MFLKYMLNQYLNRKNSTRGLSDTEFELIVDTLAEALEEHDFHHSYTFPELLSDWSKLCKFNTTNLNTSSSSRVGMKLCEHYFPNFFEIENSKGVSFSNSWKKENLVDILRWNRKSHTTPYLSELRRGIYFCCGLTKNTMYRPHLAKIVSANFAHKTVLDPCAGWGGRFLGAISARKKYIGFEPNPKTYENLCRLANNLGVNTKRYCLYNDVAENMNSYDFENVDLILTSPPYFNLEIYNLNNEKQSENRFSTYEHWRDLWLKDVISKSLNRLNVKGYSAWNVHTIKTKMNMIEDVEKIHNENGWKHCNDISLTSSKRQSNQTKKGNSKNQDLTRIFCYKD